MSTYSIYFNGKMDEEIKRTANRRGMTPVKLLKQRIKNGMKHEQTERLETRLEAIILLLELLIPEVAYTGGANRAASASAPAAVQKGTELETALKKAAALIRLRLEKRAGEEVL